MKTISFKNINNKGKKNVEIDWHVMAIASEEEAENPKAIIEYRTDTFGRHNEDNAEVVVVGKVKNAEHIMNLINVFAKMYAEGEEFDPESIHTIGEYTNSYDYKFGIVYGQYPNGDKFIQLIPECEWDWGGFGGMLN